MKCISVALIVLILTGCASLLQHLPNGDAARKYQEADHSYQQGLYKEAHDAYRALAENQPGSRWAEQSRFNAAYILVNHKNPDKDYHLAEREFEEFLNRYPASDLAGEAASWLDLLKNLGRSRTNTLLQEIEDLRKKLDDALLRQQETQAGKETVLRERETVAIEKSNLIKRIDDLLDDKDELLKEKSAFLKEREQLGRERKALEERVATLAKERESLRLAKENLEKNLRALTIVDMKMEKKRRKEINRR